MDRQLHVTKEGVSLFVINFEYFSQVSALASVTANRIEYTAGGLPVSVPYYTVNKEIEHQELHNLADIEEFDQALISELEHPDLEPGDAAIDFIYDNLHYRYIMKHGEELIGIADVFSAFGEDTKELVFVSRAYILDDV